MPLFSWINLILNAKKSGSGKNRRKNFHVEFPRGMFCNYCVPRKHVGVLMRLP